MKPTIKVSGVDEVDALLSQIAPKHARNIMRATVHGMAGEIRNEAKKRAPTDGPPVRLKRAIKAKRRKMRRGMIRSDVIVERTAWFWRFLERGTSKLPEQAFFAKTVEAFRGRQMDVFLAQFGKKFEAALARARKRSS